MLEEFLDHKLLINIKGASVEELRKLDELIGVKFLSNRTIEDIPSKDDRYLHCRTSQEFDRKYISFSMDPIDAFEERKPMPYVYYYEILCLANNFELKEDDLMNLLKE